MKDRNRAEDWRSLCELASKEADPQRLMELITKINRALEECDQPNRTDETSFKIDTVLLRINKSSRCESNLYSLPGEYATAIEYDW